MNLYTPSVLDMRRPPRRLVSSPGPAAKGTAKGQTEHWQPLVLEARLHKGLVLGVSDGPVPYRSGAPELPNFEGYLSVTTLFKEE